MNLRKLILPILSLSLVVLSCNEDDTNGINTTRDAQEVYNEDIVEIENYLATHFYNYEAFDAANPYSEANDTFKVVFDEISEENGTQDKTPLTGQVQSKTVTQNGVAYKLYYLVVREGLGDPVNALDKAAVLYNGIIPNGTQFDSADTISVGQPFNLTQVGNAGGVVTGFREGLTVFNTATGFTETEDGTLTYNNHGIGAVFIPSGLGYFAFPSSSVIPAYSPLIFSLSVISRSNTDWDSDGIPSHLEHTDGTVDGSGDDVDSDSFANYVDGDDDNDGVLTKDEILVKTYEEGANMMPFTTKAEAQAYFDANAEDNEVLVSIVFTNDETYTLNTVTLLDADNDGTPNYLDASVTTVVE